MDTTPDTAPAVILSYGMGVDSTAILLRWLEDPATAPCPLDQLVVLTAMVGDEFPETRRLVETHLLPRLAAAGVRFVQVARAGARQADGVAVLSDTRTPDRLHMEGAYRLSDELLTAGTIPQVASGKRLCSVKFKGWPLDSWIDAELAGRPFRHVMGFNAEEQRRADRDESYSAAHRASEYPLIEWGWDRAACEDYIEAVVGERWAKSCCTFCPFARDNHLARYAELPEAAADAMLMEQVSVALNPRSTLFAKKSVRHLVRAAADDDTGLAAAVAIHEAQTACMDHAVYEVRRVMFGKGVGARSVRRLATGSRGEMVAWLAEAGEGDVAVVDGVHRVTTAERGESFPTFERTLVVAPAVVDDKERAGFATSWAKVTGTYAEGSLFASAPAPAVVAAEARHHSCPDCGFEFTRPQSRCKSVAACEKRQTVAA